MVESIAEPPYDMIGKGAPTIGSNPNTIDMFTDTNIKKAVANP